MIMYLFIFCAEDLYFFKKHNTSDVYSYNPPLILLCNPFDIYLLYSLKHKINKLFMKLNMLTPKEN